MKSVAPFAVGANQLPDFMRSPFQFRRQFQHFLAVKIILVPIDHILIISLPVGQILSNPQNL